MIVNVPLNAIGEERPHVPHPGRCITKARILRARGERNLILCFLYTPNRPLSRSRAPPPRERPPCLRIAYETTRVGPGVGEGGREEGRVSESDAGVEEISPRFHGASGWHSAEATRLPRRLTPVYFASLSYSLVLSASN